MDEEIVHRHCAVIGEGDRLRLVVPTFWSPKAKLDGNSVTALPTPVSEAVFGLLGALSVIEAGTKRCLKPIRPTHQLRYKSYPV